MTDHWHNTIAADIVRLFWAAHRTLGTSPDDDHGLYDPDNERDKAAQAMEAAARHPGRKKGTDQDHDYATIPSTHIRRTGRSDPTYRQARRQVDNDTNTVTLLAHLVELWYRTVAMELHMFGRDVIGRHGGTLYPPDVQWRQQGGRDVADVPPSQAGSYVTETCMWLWWAAQALADTPTDPELHHDRLRDLQHHTRNTLKRVRRRSQRIPAARRPCKNPHGLHNHPAGEGAVEGVCRKCAQPPCAADHRPCTRRLSPEDANRGRRNCSPCRVYAHRQQKADA